MPNKIKCRTKSSKGGMNILVAVYLVALKIKEAFLAKTTTLEICQN